MKSIVHRAVQDQTATRTGWITSEERGTAGRNARIVGRKLAGERPTDIAAAEGLSRGVVLGVLFRAGLTNPTDPLAVNSARPRCDRAYRRAAVATSVARTCREAAAEWSVAYSTIVAWRREFGASTPR